jgi:hypothetical protein
MQRSDFRMWTSALEWDKGEGSAPGKEGLGDLEKFEIALKFPFGNGAVVRLPLLSLVGHIGLEHGIAKYGSGEWIGREGVDC